VSGIRYHIISLRCGCSLRSCPGPILLTVFTSFLIMVVSRVFPVNQCFQLFMCWSCSDWLQRQRRAIFVLVLVCCRKLLVSSCCCLGVPDTALSETGHLSSFSSFVKNIIASGYNREYILNYI